jgi:flagella synthesis protein FlgN
MDTKVELTEALAQVVFGIAAQSERLERALQHERAALMANDDLALDAAGRDKDLLVRTLEAHERERLHLTRSLGISAGPAPMRVALSDTPAARDAWARCLSVLERCQNINAANGRIVETKLRHVRTALELISGRDLGRATYGPAGRIAGARSPMTIAKA